MDGDAVKLPEIVKIAEEFGPITYVDDATVQRESERY